MEAVTVQRKMLATLVGCNYAGTPYELKGCINDVVAMQAVLLDRFGFAPADVTVLTDGSGDRDGVLPTGANVKRALGDMVARAAPGDVLFFHFSGHGTLVPRNTTTSMAPHQHGHRRHDDEAIVPCDLNLITDVDFRELVNRVPRGATFTMVSDSCHSGGLIDQEKEQIGPATAAADLHAAASRAGRFLPYAAVVGHLSGASGVDASHHVADHLLALFGGDASVKFHRRSHDDHDGNSSSSADADAGILLSGCQTDETSADVAADDDAALGGRACGAFSAALQTVLAAHPAPMTNGAVVRRAREVLGGQGFGQHPCLYCSDANADAPFLGQ